MSNFILFFMQNIIDFHRPEDSLRSNKNKISFTIQIFFFLILKARKTFSWAFESIVCPRHCGGKGKEKAKQLETA